MNRKEKRLISLAQLRAALEFEWNTYPQTKLAHLVARFPRRLQAVRAAKRPNSLLDSEPFLSDIPLIP